MASTINELLGGDTGQGSNSATGGTTGKSGSTTATGGSVSNGGDRGVVDYGGNGRPTTQQKLQPTSDPSENARRMVEQKRQETSQRANVQQGAASALQGDSVQGFKDWQAEKQGLNKSVVSKHHSVQETAPVQAAPSSDTGKQGFGGYLNDDGEIDTDKLRGLAVNERMKVIDQWLRQNPEETPEETARKQRRERWRNVYAALGDGIASLSNLYYTTRYAPNAYDPTQGLTARAKERYDRLQKERENTIEERLKMYDRLSTMADDLDEMKIKKQAAKANADYKASEAKRKADLAAAQQEVLKARAAKDSAATAFAEKKLEYMVNYGWPAEQAEKQAKIDLDKARTKAANASADNSEASADEHRRRGTSSWVSGSSSSSRGGKEGTYLVYDSDGNEHYYKTSQEAEYWGRKWGTWHTDSKVSTRNQYGVETKTTTEGKGYSVNPKPQAKSTTPKATKPKTSPKPKPSAKPKKKTGVSWK